MLLMDEDFLKEPVFKGIPPMTKAFYAGKPEDGLRKYRLENEAGEEKVLFLTELLSREEKELWEAIKQLFAFSVKTAEASLCGTYDLDLFYTSDCVKLRSFQPANLAALLVNHGKAMQNGETRLVRYGAGRLAFKKLVPSDWGKIRFHYGIQLFGPDRAKLDLVIKKMMTDAAVGTGSLLVLRDLGSAPVFRFGEEPQTERLGKLLEKNSAREGIEGIFYSQDGDCIDFLQQFGLRNGA